MPRRSVRFSTQVLLMQMTLLFVVCIGGFGLIVALVRNDLIHQHEQRALAIARSVALDPVYATALADGDPVGEIQRRAEAVRRSTGALFVVVTDRNGIRHSHFETALLGKPIDFTEPQALTGRDVTIFGPSSVGQSARGKVPLRDASGAIVGEIIVAIGAKEINGQLFDLLRTAAVFAGIALVIGTTTCIVLTRRMKRQTFGLEPAGLRRLVEQQAALRRVATLAANGVSPTRVFDAVTVEVSRLLRAQSTTLMRYEADGESTVVAARGGSAETDPNADTSTIANAGVVAAPVIIDGSVWGVVLASWADQSAIPSDAEARLAEFTELVAIACASAESRAQLAGSRTRVVAAADETRRRIERDLHDGMQQRLVSLALELRAVETAMPPEHADLTERLSSAAKGLSELSLVLQEITLGIHPASLSRGGLKPALKALARRSAVPVDLSVSASELVPERVEVAAYYIVSEALTNAAKHARAESVRVEIEANATAVRIVISDDGIGGANADSGSGLIGLKDRVEALGGTLDIASPPGYGTALLVEIPAEPR
jgi:sensor histidine kinase regulating citrate/malate metabolism